MKIFKSIFRFVKNGNDHLNAIFIVTIVWRLTTTLYSVVNFEISKRTKIEEKSRCLKKNPPYLEFSPFLGWLSNHLYLSRQNICWPNETELSQKLLDTNGNFSILHWINWWRNIPLYSGWGSGISKYTGGNT